MIYAPQSEPSESYSVKTYRNVCGWPVTPLSPTPNRGWAGKLNGELVTLAEAAAFDVMVTADQNLSYQQNMQDRKLALVVLSTPNKARVLANIVCILAAVNEAQTGGYVFIDIGH